MALSNIPRTQFDASRIVIRDGSATPLECEVRFDRGDFSVENIAPGGRNHTAYQSRATLHALRMTDLRFPSGSFSAMIAGFSNATAGEIIDMVYGTNGYSSRVRTSRIDGDAATLDVRFYMQGDTGVEHLLEFWDCLLEVAVAEGDPNNVTISFVCYGAYSLDGQVVAVSPYPGRLVTFAELDAATQWGVTGSSTFESPDDETWSIKQTRSTGGGTSEYAWFDLEVPEDCITDRGTALLLCEVDRPDGNVNGSIYAMLWDGSDTDAPYAGGIRNPGGTGGGADYMTSGLITTPEDGSPNSYSSPDFNALAGEPEAWAIALRFGSASLSRYARAIPIYAYGSDDDVLDGTGQDVSAMIEYPSGGAGAGLDLGDSADDDGTRAPAGSPRVSFRLGSASDAAHALQFRLIWVRVDHLGANRYSA